MELLTDNQIPLSLWNDFHRQNPFSSPFQSSVYYQCLKNNETQGIKAFAVLNKNSIKALAVINILWEKGLQSLFSGRAILYGGPLIEDSDEGKKALNIILKETVKHLRNKAIYCETRNSFDYLEYAEIFIQNRWQFTPHYTIRIDLNQKSETEILKLIHPARRREIRVSYERGALCKIATEVNEIRALYDILFELYHNKIKLPLPEFDFFKRLFMSPSGVTLLTKFENKIVGGIFCLYTPKHSLYTPYYAGLRIPKIFTTSLAVYGAMQFAMQNGIKVIDMMGAGKPGIPYGVRDFKLEFGGELLETGRYIKILNPIMYFIGETGIRIRKKIG